MNDFKGRKTGLFKPVLFVDILIDPLYLLLAREHMVSEIILIDVYFFRHMSIFLTHELIGVMDPGNGPDPAGECIRTTPTPPTKKECRLPDGIQKS